MKNVGVNVEELEIEMGNGKEEEEKGWVRWRWVEGETAKRGWR